MKEVEFANWMLLDVPTGKRRRSRWKMTREDALARDPGATVCALTQEVRLIPETPEEIADRLLRTYQPLPAPRTGE